LKQKQLEAYPDMQAVAHPDEVVSLWIDAIFADFPWKKSLG
jgi:hypothetical protein